MIRGMFDGAYVWSGNLFFFFAWCVCVCVCATPVLLIKKILLVSKRLPAVRSHSFVAVHQLSNLDEKYVLA